MYRLAPKDGSVRRSGHVCGHLTDAVFDRYDIEAESDVMEAGREVAMYYEPSCQPAFQRQL